MLERLLEAIWRYFFGQKEKIGPGKLWITGEEMSAAIDRDYSPENYFISDREFETWPLQEMKDFLKKDLLDKKDYVDEIHDCDDFSYELMGRLNERFPGRAHGIIWTEAHALNFFYCREYETIFLIEPQNDKIFYKPKDFKVHLMIG